ncbi:phosphonoacetaldehyde hydrolase [Methylocapsa sp. S129]|uniref:phosphonoacetaldehyde hydrolase n=1 Tax=Methylocapsa sp. S129 TaxID=1641869 RepID=UPI00131E5604|nr:phosphonoacetaldehyde hydrolase [Methylocapsa sp. S129]
MTLKNAPQSPSYQPYRGPVTTAIFDWAGTIIDFGCIAPVEAFRKAFAQREVEITDAEARLPMGVAKREHIERILEIPEVQARWRARTGAPSNDDDVAVLYRAFLEIDRVSVGRYSDLIPGALETIAALRARGVAIGSTTGYPREVMTTLRPVVEARGYQPDHVCTVSDVARGRPWPDMVLVNALALGAPDMRGCVVVDDSPSGLASARAAGMWAVGVTASGNEVGLSLADWAALTPEAQAARLVPGRRRQLDAGAHYTIDSIAELLPVIDAIEIRLTKGDAL